jgi:tetratricopeptide (TPR) repeat protein
VIKTPGGGILRIARDKVDRIDRKALPAGLSPDAPPRPRSLSPSPKYSDVFNGYAVKPPPGWRKVGTSKNSKATFGAPEECGPFKMDVWIIKSDGSLGTLFEVFTKQYRGAFKGYESSWEKACLLGKLPAKQFAGTFVNEAGERMCHVHTVGGEKGLFYLVFFTGAPEKMERNRTDFDACFETFEVLPPLDLDKAEMDALMTAFSKGTELVHAGKDAEAVAEFVKAAEILPKYADTWQNLAVLNAKLGNQKEAIEAYTTLSKLRPDDPQPLYDLGTLLFKANRYPDAIAALEKAIELAPDYVEAWINVGAVRSQTAEYDGAAAAFRTAIEIDPKCSPAWYNLGQVEHIRKNYAKAKEAFEAALKIDPEHKGAKDGLRKLKQEGH